MSFFIRKLQLSIRKAFSTGFGLGNLSSANLLQHLWNSERSKEENFVDGKLVDWSTTGDPRPVQKARGYLFDGVDDFVSLPFALNATTSYEITGYFSTTSVLGMFLVDARDEGTVGLRVYIAGGKIYIYHNNSVATVTTSLSNYNDGVTHRFSVAWDGANVTINMDDGDEIVTSAETTAMNTTTNIKIGARSFSTPANFFDGVFHSGNIATDGVLRSNHKMDEGGGTTSYDSSGNENHGAITNATLATFHATFTDGTGADYQNQVGYSDPIDEVTNGEFNDWTGSDPDGWEVAEGTGMSVEESSGGGKARFVGINNGVHISQAILTVGRTYNVTLECTSHSGVGDLGVGDSSGLSVGEGPFDVVSTGKYSGTFVATSDTFYITRISSSGATIDVTIDSVVVREAAIIPRDESSPELDVLGNPLQYTGRVPYNAAPVGSPCSTFNGINHYIQGVTPRANYTTEDFSFSIFVYVPSGIGEEGNLRIFSNGRAAKSGYEIFCNERVALRTSQSGVNQVSYYNLPSADKDRFIHLCVQRVGAIAKVFIDGEERTLTASVSHINPVAYTENYSIGRYSAYTQFLFQGSWCGLQLHGRELTQEEITRASNGEIIKDGLDLCVPASESDGNLVFDSKNNEQLIIQNASVDNWTTRTQDLFHYGLRDGEGSFRDDNFVFSDNNNFVFNDGSNFVLAG